MTNPNNHQPNLRQAPSDKGAVALDPATLPALDIVKLAQEGHILRAERDLPPHGVPAFVTKEGWDELMKHYGQGKPPEEAARTIILPALEKSVRLLMAKAAEARHKAALEAHVTQGEDGEASQKNSPAVLPRVFTAESDLFPSHPETRLVLVRNADSPVVCALVGTPGQLTALLGQAGHSPQVKAPTTAPTS
ncbi:hypothetical protein E3E12_05840 [Formicincola oecophyllae]|uniref:Uncharacterized protein n=1 Tax=Formicincola oecophyllae TaxID=2558361 RepID=A0A4Y6UCD9_9PROT|nr:hypothetical protein [Formicincola oecophyllae]QDH13785.1 hypothetical protein E3E12_05840 [Formicincola oecophyllae]